MQDSGYHSCALSNGLKLHVLERRELPIVVLMVLYSVGSSHETPAQYGMAHFLEHMMFKGSEQFPLGSIDLFSHRSGGENNAFTSRDFTVYYHVLPARHWKSALEIEIDRMCSLQLEEAEYESEKRVVLEELSMYEDDPQEALYDFHYSKAFSKAHPYHHPIIGTRDVLLAQDLKMMEEFYRSNYRVDNASLLLLGDLNASLATRAIQKMFEGVSASEAPLSSLTPAAEAPGIGDNEVHVVEQDVDLVRISMSLPSHRSGDCWEAPSAIFEELVSGGRTSRFVKTLREEMNLVQNVSIYSDSHALGGRQILEADLCGDQDPLKCLKAFVNEVSRLHREPISKKELDQGRIRALVSHSYDQERLENLGFSLTQWISVDQPQGYFHFPEALERVDLATMNDYVGRFFLPENATLGISCPRGEGLKFRNLKLGELFS